ncbi:amidase [Acidisphaera sp. L21]|uniref:amidase n=1 Tax=Acidisphaera sp. L21 TaxID=1641851 RepID=UPI001C203621|nr:amidase [Acidisphaera sp. L21]
MNYSPSRMSADPATFSASQAAALLKTKQLSCEELVRACLARIAARDPVVKAWLSLDPDYVIARARALDKLPPTGALHGLPWGVKDVIDTFDYPTTQNSPIYDQLKIGRDAACVGVVRGSGALILGKTDTVEFASSGRKALSTNPYNPAHTPGGSSSGSGAAVGDYQVPLAFGTQTGGSHIRPASFNGIYGHKPTWGRVSREGVRMSSMTLDTIGWYGRSVDDLILVGIVFRIAEDTTPITVRGLRIGLCRSPVWHAIEPGGVAALDSAAAKLSAAGAIIEELVLPEPFTRMHAAHAAIMAGEGAASFLPEYVNAYEKLAQPLRDRVENSTGSTPEQWLQGYALADRCRVEFDALFGPALDVVLTPSSPGEAPEGLHTTGNAIFNSMWTLLHGPNVGIPSGRGPKNLPVGVTLVGPRMSDSRLLAIAKALAPIIDTDEAGRLSQLWG